MHRLAFVFGFLIACLPSISVAQTTENPDSALGLILQSLAGEPLGLQEAVQQGLGAAVPLKRAEAAYLAAGGSVRRESGFYDPRLFFNLSHLDQQLPVASFFAGAPVLATQQTISQTGLQLMLPIGTQLQLALSTTSLSTNSSLAFLNPEYDAYGTLSIRQPLLGGFAASARKRLTQAERALEAENNRYDQESINVAANVEMMYWDLYAAVRDYAVQKLTRDRADAFLKDTEVRASTGLVGPNQVATAKTFLAEQEIQLLDREEALDQQSDALSALIGRRPKPGTVRFRPTDEPHFDLPPDSVDRLVEKVKEGNKDLQAAQKDVEAARVLASAAGWEALPSVNLTGALGGNGLAGTGQQVIILNDSLPRPETAVFGDAINQVGKRTYPNWSVGLEVSVPIGFRSGLGEKDRLEADVLNAEQVYLDKERGLEEQVRSTYRELAHGKGRLEAARAEVDAAQDQVRIGMIEYHQGRSTAFELVRLGEDLAVAERRYSEALVRTAKAAALLKELTSGL